MRGWRALARDAYYFLIPLAVMILVCLLAGWVWSGIILLLLAGFVGFFFRDPQRVVPTDRRAIVSPADGRVVRLEPKGENLVLSIFLSIFDVHVNRAPIGGMITQQEYHPGKFKIAYDDEASVQNERVVITIAGDRELTFSLIAGMVARRICPWKKEGERVSKGDRIALIRFGSRVDVMLPPECESVVDRGDRVYAGSTTIAYWNEDK